MHMKATTYAVRIDLAVTPEEVLFVREEKDHSKLEIWTLCLSQALCVVSAREEESGKLLGIGFLVGNQRHGNIVDLSVHSSVRKAGLGGQILDRLVKHAKELEITYLGLTYDQRSPWLKDFYYRHGFRLIDFAMWEEGSLPG